VLLSGVMMLRHIGEFEAASRIEQAVLVTLEEEQVRTGDVVGYDKGSGTTEFAYAVIANLGRTPRKTAVRSYHPIKLPDLKNIGSIVPKVRRTTGADIFVESKHGPVELGQSLEALVAETPLKLKMISNRGTKVYPSVGAMTDCVDQYRCRFILRDDKGELHDDHLLQVTAKIATKHRWMHIEKLCEFDGQASYTKAQGED
jgi:isocitrate dehydrogenase